MIRKEQVMSYVNVILNTILLLLSLFTIAGTLYLGTETMAPYVKMVSAVIIVMQIVSIYLSNKYEAITEQETFQMSKKQLFEETKPYSDAISLQNSREELRLGLHILLTVVMVICLYLCSKLKSILLFIAVISIILIAYMYADYIPNAILYAQLYDKQYIREGERANAVRGLARIYLEEYRETKFNRNHSFYRKIQYFSEDKDVNQDICIKNILFMQMDNIRCPKIVYSIILLVINIFLVIPNLLDMLIYEIFGSILNDMFFVKSIIQISINTCFAIINIYTCVHYKSICEEIKALSDSINDKKKNSRNNRLAKYYKYKDNSSRRFEKVRVRGIYVFCSDLISKGKVLDGLPIQCRMQYIHKLYTNIQRYYITVILLAISFISLLCVYHVNQNIIAFLLLIYMILVISFRKFALPEIGKKAISRQCEVLLKEK